MRKTYRVAFASLQIVGLAAIVTACGEDSPLGDLAEQCGLVCPSEGIVQGNAAISGISSIDAFFGAVIDVTGSADGVSANIRAQLDGMAASLGLPAGASGAEIKAALEAKIAAHVDGGVTIGYKPAECKASVEVAAKAAAECDAEVESGSVEVSCEGKCTIDASAQADCSAKGTLTCKGTAPNLACDGTCTGDCSLETSAMCTGVCRGTCNGTCSVQDAAGNCKGECSGTCQGTCELKAGGTCSGKCEGTCEYTPPSGSCEATAEARCEASASANIKCKGGCEGKATPPSVKAECKAAVEAKAEASIECTPPELDIKYQFAAGVDAEAQAEFIAFLGNFKVQYAGMIAAIAKADVVLKAGENLKAAATGAVKGGAEALAAEADLKLSIGAGCAVAELPNVATAIEGSASKLSANVQAAGEITAVFGG